MSIIINADQARKNTDQSWKDSIDYELKDIFNKIKKESTTRGSLGSIVVNSINEKNVEILKEQGFNVYQYTYGASKFQWNISW